MQKRILIVSGVFPPEQVTSAYLNYDLAKALSKEFAVTVLRPRPTRPIGAKFPEEWSDPDFETILIDSYTHPQSELLGRLKEARDFSKKSVEYLKAHKDEIDFVYNDGWQLFGLYIIAKACVKYNIPYFVPIQDTILNCYPEPETEIGPGVVFPHGFPLVIHSHAILGKRCIAHPNVQIGTTRTKEGALVIGDYCF